MTCYGCAFVLFNSFKVIPVHALSTTRDTCYAHLTTLDLIFLTFVQCQSRWPCCLMRKSAASGLRVSPVPIPMKAWLFISCVCCVFCKQLPMRQADQTFRGVPPDVWVLFCVIHKPQNKRPRHDFGCSATKKKRICIVPKIKKLSITYFSPSPFNLFFS